MSRHCPFKLELLFTAYRAPPQPSVVLTESVLSTWCTRAQSKGKTIFNKLSTSHVAQKIKFIV
jgi:hypothetical protein